MAATREHKVRWLQQLSGMEKFASQAPATAVATSDSKAADSKAPTSASLAKNATDPHHAAHHKDTASLESEAKVTGASDATTTAVTEAYAAGDLSLDAARTKLLADGLGLPAEAANSGMTADQMKQLVAELQLAGDETAFRDTKTWKVIAEQGAKQGANTVLTQVIAEGFGLPVEAANSGMTADQMKQFVANLQFVGDETVFRDKKTWKVIADQGPSKAPTRCSPRSSPRSTTFRWIRSAITRPRTCWEAWPRPRALARTTRPRTRPSGRTAPTSSRGRSPPPISQRNGRIRPTGGR